MAGVDRAGDGYTARINNNGGIPAPFDLAAHFSDGTDQIIHQTARAWAANPRTAAVPIPTRKSLQSLVIQTGIWLDADSTNNRWSATK